ncbi:MAG: phage holin family protein [Bacteroidetes bacterium]|nr:phage holin family protein [Bacteroidota bacterium]
MELIQKIAEQATGIMLMWAIMIGVVIIDFWTGIDKAKSRHEPIHSKGLRKTITKVGEYWRVLVMFLFIDIIGTMLPWYSLPYASMLCTLSIILIEIRSVIENLKAKKSSASEITEMVKEIISIDNPEKAVSFLKNLNK